MTGKSRVGLAGIAWIATPLGYVKERKEITPAAQERKEITPAVQDVKKDATVVLSARERFLQRKAEKEAAANK
ncbi:hypothetical protein T484DRAFT_1903509 [Baffinella frigidus]|nr:hypothetical protein T484DRAFT_1903509 [Cryptophyta sp. CCMP2293]